MVKILQYVGGALFLVACVLTANDWSTESGVWGIVASYEIRFFGSFGGKLTAIVTLLLWSLPALAAAGLSNLLGGGSLSRPSAKPDPNAPPEVHAAFHRRQAGSILYFAALAGALGVIFFGWLTYKAKLLREANVGVWNLETATGPPPADARFAQLVGTPHRDMVFTIERNKVVETHFYPLTSADWLPERPVHFLVRGSGPPLTPVASPTLPAPKPPKGAPPAPATKFSALTETATGEFVPVPQFVRDAFEKGGVAIAPDCRMLKKTVLGETGARESEFFARIAVFGGLGVAGLFGLAGLLSLRQMRKFQRLT
jgi:hypothetical protein